MVESHEKLRFTRPAEPLHVVLVEPEIPQNTGNIARLCAATGSVLHLVGPLGFDISEKAVRRAGLDYWKLVDVRRHDDLDAWLAAERPADIALLSARGRVPHTRIPFRPGMSLVLGCETRGLSDAVLTRFPDRVHAIPTLPGIRSLNLANAAAVVVYEALRVTGALDGTFVG